MINRVFACVIGSQGQPDVSVEPIQEVPQVLSPTGDVVVRVVEITHAVADGGFRNQLHEPYRSRPRDYSRIKRRFGLHDRKEQSRLNVVLLRRTDDCLLKFQIRHTTVIPYLAANYGDSLICRNIPMVYQSCGTDVSIGMHI